ncbi:hypothetical protein ACHAWF_006696 [Thalassiosira exigua]
MDIDDQGHRYGNFPNYYSFHPPDNRLDILKQTNILDCLCRGIPKNNESARKMPRLEDDQSPLRAGVVFYCDLGCNEGNLTMAVANALTQPCNIEGKSIPSDESKVVIQCLGLDLDPMLISRASANFSSPKIDSGSSFHRDVDATFKVCNLCSESAHNEACAAFMSGTVNRKGDATNATEVSGSEGCSSVAGQLFYLTTIFSTTMWIHVHAGDDGLREFLQRACRWTERYILIEPQPSGCYRKANIRLRKMGRPELDDVTSTRLKMRSDIEMEVEKVVIGCGFRRVALDELVRENTGDVTTPDVTSWNRTVCLYERIIPL